MTAAAVPEREEERIAALRRYGVLDTPQETAFDDIARLASDICRTPIALVSLVDRARQWMKSVVGADGREVPREWSFCAHAIHSDTPFVVHDVLSDVRFADNPMVTGPPFIRFYAGAPLTTPEGLHIGTLCVLDSEPRTLGDEQLGALRALAQQVMVQLELRRQIAERVATEARLRESEMLFRTLADSAPVGIYRTRDDGLCDYTNRRWQEISGQTFEESLGHGWLRALHSDDRQGVLESWCSAASRGQEWSEVYRIGTPSGEAVVLSRAARVAELGCWVGTVLDITEQYRAAEALRASEARLQRVLEGSNDGFWDWDVRTGAVEFSDRLVRMIGYEPGELPPHVSSWAALVHPDDLPGVMAQLADHVEGKSEQYEAQHRLRCRNGEWLWILDRGKIVERDAEGRPVWMAGTHTNISRRKKFEEDLRRSEARTRSIIENSLGALITTDARGIIESANPATETMFRCSRDQLIGRSVCDLVARPFASRRECLEYLRDNALNRITELQGRRADGKVFECELSLFEFYAGDGQPHFAGHMLDISQRQEVERMKKDFVATVSHELRTPLTSIRGSLGLLASGVMGELSDEARQLVHVAERNSVRLIALINDMLDFEKLEHGKMEMRLAPAPLVRILERSVETVGAFAAQEGVEIRTQCPAVVVHGDEDRLTQVTVNLLSNAVKHSPRGGVVRISARGEEGGVVVSIHDDGPGIAPGLQTRLFQRFQQIESDGSPKKSGTGLGLAICRAIIEAHRGTIGVDSREGEGSTFWFSVPGLSSVTSGVAAGGGRA